VPARRSFLVVLGVVVGLPTLALVVRMAGLVVPANRRPPEAIDREKLRAEIAAKRARGEDIAVRTIQDAEWEKQKPGVEFVVRGDAFSAVVDLQVETPPARSRSEGSEAWIATGCTSPRSPGATPTAW
jgi:hypothetical protein